MSKVPAEMFFVTLSILDIKLVCVIISQIASFLKLLVMKELIVKFSSKDEHR